MYALLLEIEYLQDRIRKLHNYLSRDIFNENTPGYAYLDCCKQFITTNDSYCEVLRAKYDNGEIDLIHANRHCSVCRRILGVCVIEDYVREWHKYSKPDLQIPFKDPMCILYAIKPFTHTSTKTSSNKIPPLRNSLLTMTFRCIIDKLQKDIDRYCNTIKHQLN